MLLTKHLYDNKYTFNWFLQAYSSEPGNSQPRAPEEDLRALQLPMYRPEIDESGK